jgi:hypothetical protein
MILLCVSSVDMSPTDRWRAKSSPERFDDSAAPIGGCHQPDRSGEERVPARETAAAECGCVVKVGLLSASVN